MTLRNLIKSAVLAGMIATSAGVAGTPLYAIDTVLDASTGNIEYRFMDGAFHWGTVIRDPGGRLIFRPHPDQHDVNGFGSSWYMSPFLAGSDPRGGVVSSIAVGANGIAVALAGPVPLDATANFGTWSFSGTFGYDARAQVVNAEGTLEVTLDALLSTIGRDLNLDRIASNFLHGVPLQGGGVGDTGDMQGAAVNYAAGTDPRNFVWHPVAQPGHFPTDASNHLEIDAAGTVNRVDTLALGEGFQIAIARKPSLGLTFVSESDLLSAGLFWNAAQAHDWEQDNIGMNHLLLWQNSTDTSLRFDVIIVSSVPVTEPMPLALMLGVLAMLLVAKRVRGSPVRPGLRR